MELNKNFNAGLLGYIRLTGYSNKNFVLSPISLRSALALAAVGASGETKTQLLDALGFNSDEELINWYDNVSKGLKAFYNSRDHQDGEEYRVENSIWKNTNTNGELLESYKDRVLKDFNAQANEASPDSITDRINDWVNNQTNGFIQKIVDDASAVDLVLVNALYLKGAWLNEFNETFNKYFNTINNIKVTKEFMRDTYEFNYFEDDITKLVELPMHGRVSMVVVLGDDSDILDKLSRSEYTRVSVEIPKFEIESTYNKNELKHYLQVIGAKLPFSDLAEFNEMISDTKLYISDIIQKAKIKTNEDGIEASAATAVMMFGAMEIMDVEEPKSFIADRPFSFYVINKIEDTTEILLYGQYVE